MSQVDPNGILAIFLPCLIFESAFKTEWHTFKKLAAQSLILGVLSSLVCASLIMLILKLVIDQENVQLMGCRCTAGMRPCYWGVY